VGEGRAHTHRAPAETILAAGLRLRSRIRPRPRWCSRRNEHEPFPFIRMSSAVHIAAQSAVAELRSFLQIQTSKSVEAIQGHAISHCSVPSLLPISRAPPLAPVDGYRQHTPT